MAASGLSRHASVLHWLQQLPSSEFRQQRQHNDHQTLKTSPTPTRKRRRPLEDMNSNVQTPKRLHKDDAILDTERTPRQTEPHGWISPVSFPPPSFQDLDLRSITFQEGSPDRGSGSQTRSDSNLSSKKRKRTPSPRKILGLRYAAYRIDPAGIQSWRSMPEKLQSLTKSMIICKSGRSIVSPEYPLDDLRDEVADEHLASTQRQALGGCPRADWVEEIVLSTSFCSTRKVSEAAWNCDVHSRILRQALRCSSCAYGGSRLRWHNITTASIEPATLLPIASESTSESTTFQARKADFALCLELPEHVARQLSLAGVNTLNPTFYEAIRFSPLACTLETKLTGENWDDAKTQIETWASAQVSHLRGMLQKVGTHAQQAETADTMRVDPLDSMPALPFFIVQGKSWHFLYLQVMADRAVLWDDVLVGDTASTKGVHQVITALLAVMDWAEKVWRPWYQDAILGPLCIAIQT